MAACWFQALLPSRLLLALSMLVAWWAIPTPAPAATDAQQQAEEILATSGIRGGFVVHLGCGDGKLTAAIAANPSYVVQGLERDAGLVRQARQHVESLGLYGRVSVEQCSGNRLPYADNIVNLLVGEDLAGVPTEEVLRVLAPQGVACIKQANQWTKTTKPRPEEMDEWTHYLHGPDNNAVANDQLVGSPYHLQWLAGPVWARSHDHLASVSAMVSSGGRVFAIVDEAPAAFVVLPASWSLVARDAFSGVLLWKRKVEPWEWHLRGFRSGPPEISRTLVAAGDRVYVTLGYGEPVVALDGATGNTLQSYEQTAGTTEIVFCEGVLFLVAGDRPQQASSDVAEPWWRGVTPSAQHKRILAVDAESGKLLWKKADAATSEIMPTTLAVSGRRVFFENPQHVIALDASTGEELWRAERPIARSRLGWSTPTLVVCDNVVLSADRDPQATARPGGVQPAGVQWVPSSAGGIAPEGQLIAFAADTGERLWSAPCREGYNSPVDVLVADGLVWTGSLVHAKDPGITAGRDLLTGEVKRERPPDGQQFTVGMGHHRCYRNKATSRFLVLGRSGVEFVDLRTGRAVADHWLRGTCQYGVMPCNGLLYVPPHSCACYIYVKTNGFGAWAPRPAGEQPGQSADDGRRLQRGPAYPASQPQAQVAAFRSGALGSQAAQNASSVQTEAASDDWPTYRHDPARSGATKRQISPRLQEQWQTVLGGRLSSPVVAGGKLLVAQVDQHAVCALDATTGQLLWRFVAGGRVDSPPTIHQDTAIFGSADGRVYCVQVADGELVWRFLAAPSERRIVAYDQVESIWPVHGNVLVIDGSAYFVAGRSMFSDGGMHLYRLDAATGQVQAQVRLDGRDPATGLEPQDQVRGTHMDGALPDVLSSNGESVFLRQCRFDRQLVAQEPTVPHLFSSVGFLDDSWWHRTYWQFGTEMRSNYGGWPVVGNQVPAGRILVFDDSTVYGFGRQAYSHTGSHVGIDAQSVFHFRADRDTPNRFTHYRLFAVERADGSTSRKQAVGTQAGGGRRAQPAKQYRWQMPVPILVRAMVLANDVLFVAGPQAGDQMDELAENLAGNKGGRLVAVGSSDGQPLAQLPLKSAPVFDGMIAANGRVYLSDLAGTVLCLGPR